MSLIVVKKIIDQMLIEKQVVYESSSNRQKLQNMKK